MVFISFSSLPFDRRRNRLAERVKAPKRRACARQVIGAIGADLPQSIDPRPVDRPKPTVRSNIGEFRAAAHTVPIIMPARGTE
jgi:hypothetical protein